MALIKHAQASHAARTAVVLDLGDLKRQGDLLKLKASREAEQIIADARVRREEIVAGAEEEGRQQGYNAGYDEGRRAGLEAGRAEALRAHAEALAGLAGAWGAALDDFESRREHLLVESRLDVITLALRLAERVVKRAIDADPHAAEAQLEAVLSLISGRGRLVVAVHPDDERILADAMPGLARRFASASHAEIVPDESLARGSCVARTETGATIDASIDTQLDRLAAALLPGDGAG